MYEKWIQQNHEIIELTNRRVFVGQAWLTSLKKDSSFRSNNHHHKGGWGANWNSQFTKILHHYKKVSTNTVFIYFHLCVSLSLYSCLSSPSSFPTTSDMVISYLKWAELRYTRYSNPCSVRLSISVLALCRWRFFMLSMLPNVWFLVVGLTGDQTQDRRRSGGCGTWHSFNARGQETIVRILILVNLFWCFL